MRNDHYALFTQPRDRRSARRATRPHTRSCITHRPRPHPRARQHRHPVRASRRYTRISSKKINHDNHGASTERLSARRSTGNDRGDVRMPPFKRHLKPHAHERPFFPVTFGTRAIAISKKNSLGNGVCNEGRNYASVCYFFRAHLHIIELYEKKSKNETYRCDAKLVVLPRRHEGRATMTRIMEFLKADSHETMCVAPSHALCVNKRIPFLYICTHIYMYLLL